MLTLRAKTVLDGDLRQSLRAFHSAVAGDFEFHPRSLVVRDFLQKMLLGLIVLLRPLLNLNLDKIYKKWCESATESNLSSNRHQIE